MPSYGVITGSCVLCCRPLPNGKVGRLANIASAADTFVAIVRDYPAQGTIIVREKIPWVSADPRTDAMRVDSIKRMRALLEAATDISHGQKRPSSTQDGQKGRRNGR